MARLASKVKLGHYPTPPPVARAVARYLKAQHYNARFRVLDPCVGDATAIQIIVDTLQRQHGRFASFDVSTYGIEPQAPLAQAAADRIPHVLHTSFFSTTLSNGTSADGGWQFIYPNSPYDDDTELTRASGRKDRLEFTFLQRATLKLCPNGILVWVIPYFILLRPGVAKFLTEHYDQMHCVRFPDEMWHPPESREEVSMYAQFKQIVLFGRLRPKPVPAEQEFLVRIEEWGRQGDRLPIIGTERHIPQYQVPNAPYGQLRYFLKGSFDPDEAARQVGTFSAKTKRPELGAWAGEDYWSARFPNPRKVGLAVGRPLHKFKKGYLVVFAVAGLVNRAVLEGRDGQRILVKGYTRKTTHYHKEEDESEIIEKVTDKFESSLWCTDLSTGALILVQTGGFATAQWSVEYETLSMQAFLDNFGSALMQQVMKRNLPRYRHVSQIPWAKQALSQLIRQPLGKQYDIILAQVNAFVNRWQEGGMDEDELLICIAEVAEMASGKTFMAIATAFLADLSACGCTDLATHSTRLQPFFPAVVLSPPIMARKWKREIEQTIPNVRVVIVDRFGPSRASNDDDDEEDEEGNENPVSSDASADFRAFDPDFTGSSLGTVGCVDRIVACISYELDEWRKRCHAAKQAGKSLPPRPCHVVIVTSSTAKLTPEWCVQYRLKPMRSIEDGMVTLLKRANGEPAMVPCCPYCSSMILDERRVRQQLKNSREYREQVRERGKQQEERRLLGSASANRLHMIESHIEEYLSAHSEYRKLIAEREALREGQAPQDERYLTSEEQIRALLEHLRATDTTHRLLEEGSPEAEQYLLFHSEAYRTLIIAQDQLFRTLQWECEERIERFRDHLARTDEGYQRHFTEAETVRSAVLHQAHRLAPYEEEAVSPISLAMDEIDLIGTKDHRVKRSCSQCGSPLWQYVAKRQKSWRPFSVQNAGPRTNVVVRHGKASGVHIVGSTHVSPLPLPDRGVSYPCVSNTYKRRYPIDERQYKQPVLLIKSAEKTRRIREVKHSTPASGTFDGTSRRLVAF